MGAPATPRGEASEADPAPAAPTAGPHSTHVWWLVCAVVVGGIIVRLATGYQREVWLNEACSLIIARKSLNAIWQATAYDVHPPLFYFSLAAVRRLTPDPVLGGRALSLLFSVGLIPVTYGVARLWLGRAASLLAAALIAISPALCWHGTELRMYPLIGLLAGGLLWAGFRGLRGGAGSGPWMLLVACGTLGLYTSYFFVPLLIALAVGVLAVHAREPRLLGKWLVALLIIGVLWSPWWFAFFRALRFVEGSFWTERVGLVQACRHCKMLLDVVVGLDHGWPNVPAWGDRLLRLGVLAMLALGGVSAWRTVRMRALLVTATAFFAGIVLVSCTVRSLIVARSLLLAAPMIVVLLIAGIRSLPPAWHLPIAGLFVALPVPRLTGMVADTMFPGPLATTADVIERFSRPGDIAAHTSMWTYYPLRHYTGARLEHRLLLPSNFSGRTADALGEVRADVGDLNSAERLWLFVLDDPLHEGRDARVRADLCQRRQTTWRGSYGNVELLLLEQAEAGTRSPRSMLPEHTTEGEPG